MEDSVAICVELVLGDKPVEACESNELPPLERPVSKTMTYEDGLIISYF